MGQQRSEPDESAGPIQQLVRVALAGTNTSGESPEALHVHSGLYLTPSRVLSPPLLRTLASPHPCSIPRPPPSLCFTSIQVYTI